MANNCCTQPLPPSKLEGTILQDVVVKGDTTYDSAASQSIIELVEQLGLSDIDLTDVTLRGDTTYDADARDALITVVEQALGSDEDFRDQFLKTLLDAILNDEDLLEALKACIISSINRCDGSSHAVGDTLPTCDEMTAAITEEMAAIDDNLGKITTSTPRTTTETELPTTIVGNRAQVLGRPAGYLSFGGKLVPYY